MKFPVCDHTGWVCENHPDRPWRGFSQRFDAMARDRVEAVVTNEDGVVIANIKCRGPLLRPS
jgi:hypothetical protein